MSEKRQRKIFILVVFYFFSLFFVCQCQKIRRTCLIQLYGSEVDDIEMIAVKRSCKVVARFHQHEPV